ncbi:ABC transporter ATP-binding protein [Dehalobacter sp. DCM]|nr:ABC transporter ATP-binding protein [Dehalobacter sp. DCM]
MAGIIDVINMNKIYQMGNEQVIALSNITLSVEKGDFCCLLGPSGSGKSTLLNLIAGLEKPTAGEIIVNGKHLEKMNEKQLAAFRQKNIGFVFQSYNLFPTLTAVENVEMPLVFRGTPKSIRRKEAVSMLKAVGLGDRLYHKPSQMSGGQQQRVGIARAFIGVPPIVYADEPTGNLDTKTSVEIMDLITTIAKKNEQTLILVTHEKSISDYVNKIINIRDGQIEAIETREKIIIN